MKHKALDLNDDLRPEYDFDFSKGERGRYYERLLKQGSNLVVLEPAKRVEKSGARRSA